MTARASTPRPRLRKGAAAARKGGPGEGARAPAASLLGPIITMNSGGFIQSASESVEEVFGWTATELFGQNVKVLIPEPRRSSLDRYLDRYRHADGVVSLQRTRRFSAVRKDGKVIQIELSMSRADLPLHGAPYFIGIVRDVSNQIDTASELGAERSRMQHLITEQTRALATANLRILVANRLASIGTLAAGLGHDMNNVLLPVRARLNAMEHAGVPPAALGHIKAVRRAIAYLQHLSDGLHFLAVDPYGKGTSPGGSDSTNLASWWKQMGPLLAKALPRSVRLKVSLPAGLPDVKVASHWLSQAVLNLIVNAGEAIPAGRRNGLVRIEAEAVDSGKCEAVTLSIRDNGKGMSRDTLRRALDPFFTTKARGMGTGLGLALVRKVVARAGGDIEVHSELGKGTIVELTLPADRRAGTRKGSPERARTATLSVGDHRTTALVTQILIGAGVRMVHGRGRSPGKADIWVTRPTPAAMEGARRWRKQGPGRSVVLLGVPSKRAAAGWDALGATVIDAPGDFATMRYVLGRAAVGDGPGDRAPKEADA